VFLLLKGARSSTNDNSVVHPSHEFSGSSQELQSATAETEPPINQENNDVDGGNHGFMTSQLSSSIFFYICIRFICPGSGDQRRLTGSGSALEACSRRCAVQMAAFTLRTLFTLPLKISEYFSSSFVSFLSIFSIFLIVLYHVLAASLDGLRLYW